MIHSNHAGISSFNPLQADMAADRKRFVQQLLRSDVKFNRRAALRYFEQHNTDGMIERYREEFTTLLELMVEWRFQQNALKWMLKGASLEFALRQAQNQLDAQARKRVMSLIFRVCRKPQQAD